MEQIKHVCEYKELLRSNKQRLGAVNTNCMLMARDMERYIEEGRLYSDVFEDGLLVWIDEGVRDNLYYFWRPGAQLPKLRDDKSILIEEMDRFGSRSAYFSEFEPLLFSAGFALTRFNLQYERILSEAPESGRAIETQLHTNGFFLNHHSSGNVPSDVLSLWKAHLNPLDIPQDHLLLHPGESIHNLVDCNTGCIAATIWWHHSGKNSVCRHIVTDPRYLRQGLACALLNLWLDDAVHSGASRFLTWINEANAPSLSLFRKHGFAENGKTSRQYLRNRP